MAFKPAKVPADESNRALDVKRLGVMNLDQTKSYFDYVSLAAEFSSCPLSFINLIDSDNQWSLCNFGLPPEVFEGFRKIPREEAICQYALSSVEPTIIEDLKADPIFSDHPIVSGEPFLKFYAGFPLISIRGNVLGTLCLLDFKPRHLDKTIITITEKLARRVTAQLELSQEKTDHDLEQLVNILSVCVQKLEKFTLEDLLFCLKHSKGIDLNTVGEDIFDRLKKSGIVEVSDGKRSFSKNWVSIMGKLKISHEPRKRIKISENDIIGYLTDD